MNTAFQLMLANQPLVWFLFLAPFFIVMARGYVLDTRAMRAGVPSSYKPLLAVGMLPVINIPVALLCLANTARELARR